MSTLQDDLDEAVQRTGFSGVVRVERAGGTVLARAYGLADRAHGIPNDVETVFATASGTKGLTALTVMSLVEQGVLGLSTPARSLLGDDLPMIGADVTVEHLLAHRSGIGDYLDEDALSGITDYVMQAPVHQLTTSEQYLPLLDGHEAVFVAGAGFRYCNAGYVVLALLAERAAAEPFPELVSTRICQPAGMVDTAFLRSDELPGRAARGYLEREGLRTNVLHLPVLGSGDGGVYSTVADLGAFWRALFTGRIVSLQSLAEMIRPHSDWPEESRRYGLGFHLSATTDAVWLEGYDAGVSFLSLHQPSSEITYTVVSNWSNGAWPIVTLLNESLAT